MKQSLFCVTLAALCWLNVPAFAHEGEHGKPVAKTASAKIAGKTLALKLSGLHCAGCAISVKSRLMKVSGIVAVSVSPKKQSATVTLAKGAKRPTDAAIKDAVKQAGYTCVAVKG